LLLYESKIKKTARAIQKALWLAIEEKAKRTADINLPLDSEFVSNES